MIRVSSRSSREVHRQLGQCGRPFVAHLRRSPREPLEFREMLEIAVADAGDLGTGQSQPDPIRPARRLVRALCRRWAFCESCRFVRRVKWPIGARSSTRVRPRSRVFSAVIARRLLSPAPVIWVPASLRNFSRVMSLREARPASVMRDRGVRATRQGGQPAQVREVGIGDGAVAGEVEYARGESCF